MRLNGVLRCDLEKECTAKVTHIGAKGYVYCAGHVHHRRGYERTRRLYAFERKILETGTPIHWESEKNKATAP